MPPELQIASAVVGFLGLALAVFTLWRTVRIGRAEKRNAVLTELLAVARLAGTVRHNADVWVTCGKEFHLTIEKLPEETRTKPSFRDLHEASGQHVAGLEKTLEIARDLEKHAIEAIESVPRESSRYSAAELEALRGDAMVLRDAIARVADTVERHSNRPAEMREALAKALVSHPETLAS